MAMGMKEIRLVVGAVAAVCISAFAGDASAQQVECKRWNTKVVLQRVPGLENKSSSGVYPNSAQSDVAPEERMTAAQKRLYWRTTLMKEESSPLSVCKRYYKYFDAAGDDGTVEVAGVLPDGSLVCDRTSAGNSTIISLETRQREPQCNLVPKGPYARVPLPTGSPAPGPGLDFSADKVLGQNSHKDRIRLTNLDDNDGVLRSDVRWESLFPLAWNHKDGYPEDDNFTPPVIPSRYDHVDPWAGDYVNVDHIIPRVDIYGCPCGTNDSANALVISRGLNNKMSNDMYDPDRIAILQKWTTAAP